MSQVMVAHVSETQVQDRLRFQRQEGGTYETRADRMGRFSRLRRNDVKRNSVRSEGFCFRWSSATGSDEFLKSSQCIVGLKFLQISLQQLMQFILVLCGSRKEKRTK
ncbi:hypothetical protein YC2023_045385 [Brassica napus]